MIASPTARNLFLVLISTFPVHLSLFLPTLSLTLTALVLANTVYRAGPRNKIGHHASSSQLTDAGSHVECPQNINRLRNMSDCVP